MFQLQRKAGVCVIIAWLGVFIEYQESSPLSPNDALQNSC